MSFQGRHHREVMKHLLSCGGIVDDRTRAGKTPLHIAAKAGRLELVEILLRHHAHPSVGDNTGQTPLHLAAGYDMTGNGRVRFQKTESSYYLEWNLDIFVGIICGYETNRFACLPFHYF